MKTRLIRLLTYLIFPGRKNFSLGTTLLAIFCVSLGFGAEVPEGEREATEFAANLHMERGLAHMAEGGEANLFRAKQEFEFIINMKYDMGHKGIAYLNLGVIHFIDGDPEQAIKHYHSAIGLRPDYPEAYFNLGTAYYKQGLLAKAEESFRKAVELQPNYGRAHYSLGSVYFDQKKYDLAAKHAEKARESGVTYKTLKEKLAKLGK